MNYLNKYLQTEYRQGSAKSCDLYRRKTDPFQRCDIIQYHHIPDICLDFQYRRDAIEYMAERCITVG